VHCVAELLVMLTAVLPQEQTVELLRLAYVLAVALAHMLAQVSVVMLALSATWVKPERPELGKQPTEVTLTVTGAAAVALVALEVVLFSVNQ
jgi:hypothetical protein